MQIKQSLIFYYNFHMGQKDMSPPSLLSLTIHNSTFFDFRSNVSSLLNSTINRLPANGIFILPIYINHTSFAPKRIKNSLVQRPISYLDCLLISIYQTLQMKGYQEATMLFLQSRYGCY